MKQIIRSSTKPFTIVATLIIAAAFNAQAGFQKFGNATAHHAADTTASQSRATSVSPAQPQDVIQPIPLAPVPEPEGGIQAIPLSPATPPVTGLQYIPLAPVSRPEQGLKPTSGRGAAVQLVLNNADIDRPEMSFSHYC